MKIDVKQPSGGVELAYAEATTDQIVSSASAVDLTGLTTGSVTVGLRPVLVTVHIPSVKVATSLAIAGLYLLEDDVLIAETFFQAPAANANGVIYTCRRRSLTAGSSHTWKAQASSSSGNSTFKAVTSTFGTMFITVVER